MLEETQIPSSLFGNEERPEVRTAQRQEVRWRFGQVVRELFPLFVKILSGVEPEEGLSLGRRSRDSFDRLGGLWLWLAEYLSLFDDALGRDFCFSLQELSTRSTGFSFDQVRQIIEESYGQRMETLFEEFDRVPWAIGTTSQVHRARLSKTNTLVAVKVRRPDVDMTFARDHKIFLGMLKRMNRFRRFDSLQIEDALWEFEQQFREDLDFRREWSSLRKMRRTLRSHSIYVPRTWDRFRSQRVVVMEWIEGVSLMEAIRCSHEDGERFERWSHENQVDRVKVAKRLFQTFLRQVLEEDRYHGDWHPSNILLLKDSRIALVDFGSVGRSWADFQELHQRYLQAISEADYHRATHSFVSLREPIPPVDLDRFQRRLLAVFRAWDARESIRSLPFEGRSMIALNEDLAAVTREFRFGFEWSLFRVDLGFKALDTVFRNLAPQIRYRRELQRYFQKYEARTFRKTMRDSLVSVDAGMALSSAGQLPRNVGDLLRSMDNMLLRGAIGLEESTNKMAVVMQVFLARARQGVLLVGGILSILFLHQRWDGFSLPSESSAVLSWFSDAPILSGWDWIILFIAWWFLYRGFGHIVSRLASRQHAHVKMLG
ncbi:MAG: AarF/ABC1/UbiB kinase family protein [Planctomycetota bacterium]|jgi:ubiquinone biosynthesis protein|nr:AarF/ABC1/UbiB kinase family protein [Planctomycetota bacterium]